ncbi:hypothetical protein [Clostridium intestinale]|uniref:Uncharacterized protein n=1 Tax=Clostridium intestinale DSM 6191 TaxID=1121320 RepID=A0A1M5U1U0_9CLOT|nr:hypothetical protein [Clostridium intestinale]SHH56938.1 hypothetical protein SAMN02745941_00382 [Clostridium intestinale DSM 6191]
MKLLKDWRNRDWCWIVSILIGIIIVVLTWRLNDNSSVVNIISMFASGASIILAVVAIVQSTLYNTSSNELNSKMTEKLSLIENTMEIVKDNILRNTNTIIDNSPIPKEEKEELKRRVEYLNNKESLIKIFESNISVQKNKLKHTTKLEDEIGMLINTLDKSINKNVSYRVDGTNQFKHGTLTTYSYNKNNNLINIVIDNDSIITKNITEVSFSKYDDRIDIWIYGDKTNRFNIDL